MNKATRAAIDIGNYNAAFMAVLFPQRVQPLLSLPGAPLELEEITLKDGREGRLEVLPGKETRNGCEGFKARIFLDGEAIDVENERKLKELLSVHDWSRYQTAIE